MAASTENRLRRALRRSVECFRKNRIPYALIGAWALAVWGRPRATQDVDFLVLVDEAKLERIANRMVKAGMEIDQVWHDWNPMLQGTMLRLQCDDVAVDLLRPRDAHDQQALRRRRRKLMDGRYYWFVAPEDLMLQKLKAGRMHDFDDVLSVVEHSRRHLNRKYLSQWADRLGISAELNHIMTP